MIQTLILHAGTPKTGTTSLHVYLDRQRETLLRKGILYPRYDETADAAKPKHQWIVNTLLAPDSGEFIRKMDRVLAKAEPGTHTMILSTEGLFHHWWDFSAAGRQALASLARRMSVRVWVWFREPVAFVRANYVQMLRNPRMFVQCYGRDLSIEEMLDDPWFSQRLDYIGFVREMEGVLGRGAVVPFEYRGNTIDAFLRALGVTGMAPTNIAEHPTMGEFGVELLRLLNRYDLPADQKRAGVARIGELDAMLGLQSQPLTLTSTTIRRIRDLASESVNSLERDFGLSFPLPVDEGATDLVP